MIIWFIAGFIVLLTLGLLYLGVSNFNVMSEEVDGPWDLSKAPAIPSGIVDLFSKNTNSTLRVFYYIDTLPRTNAALLDASVPSFNAQTNMFEICEPDGPISCAHPGFVKLLNISNTFYIELLQAPDASRPGLPKTQFVIQTQKKDTSTPNGPIKNYLETHSLPEFPLQKWIMLTVSRSGNRINIFYNDRLVFSKNTTYIPNILPGTGNYSSAVIRGQAKYVYASNTTSNQVNVRSDFLKMADTRGEPLDKLFQKINITLCPSGNCFSGPEIRPANPLLQWSSDVM